MLRKLGGERVKNVASLDGKMIVQLLDCGGQPQFLEILPRFIGDMSLGILVIDLSQRLDEHPLSFFFGEDGQPIGEAVKSSMTNKQLLSLFLRMIVSQSQDVKKVKFLIVGTHRDEESKSIGETTEEKEQKITTMITSSGMEDNVIYTDESHKHIIFAVNAKTPEDQDVILGQKIMAEIMNKSRSKHVSIPLKYLNLELTLKETSTTEKFAFSVDEVFDLMKHYFEDKESLQAGLQYLNNTFHTFYFSDLKLVFGEPQLLLNFITKIIVRHIELTTNPKTSTTSAGCWKSFKEQGIISDEILQHFLESSKCCLSVSVLVEILETLLIICKTSKGKYLMPCLLTTTATMTKTSKPSMLLHFQQGLARFGIFSCTICKLVSSYKWTLHSKSGNHRNGFQFRILRFPGIVTLNDSIGSYFQVILDICPEFSHKCVEVRDTLIRVINEVSSELIYSPDPPVLAFMCDYPHDPDMAPHAAEYIKEDDYLLCTQNCMATLRVSNNNRIWLQGLREDSFQAFSSVSTVVTQTPSSREGKFEPSIMHLKPKEKKHQSNNSEDAAITYPQYVKEKPRSFCSRLQCEIQYDQHIRRLAERMIGWEEKYDLLSLEKYEVHDIKNGANAYNPVLQRIEVLHKWCMKRGLHATYGSLLQIFIEGKFSECTAVMEVILKEDWTNIV